MSLLRNRLLTFITRPFSLVFNRSTEMELAGCDRCSFALLGKVWRDERGFWSFSWAPSFPPCSPCFLILLTRLDEASISSSQLPDFNKGCNWISCPSVTRHSSLIAVHSRKLFGQWILQHDIIQWRASNLGNDIAMTLILIKRESGSTALITRELKQSEARAVWRMHTYTHTHTLGKQKSLRMILFCEKGFIVSSVSLFATTI